MCREKCGLRRGTALSKCQLELTRYIMRSFFFLIPLWLIIAQNFLHFDCTSPVNEPEKRFHYFTTQVLPTVLKSAVQSTNTIIFVPSSFDFIRIQNYFRKQAGVTFTVLSECVKFLQSSRSLNSSVFRFPPDT